MVGKRKFSAFFNKKKHAYWYFLVHSSFVVEDVHFLWKYDRPESAWYALVLPSSLDTNREYDYFALRLCSLPTEKI